MAKSRPNPRMDRERQSKVLQMITQLYDARVGYRDVKAHAEEITRRCSSQIKAFMQDAGARVVTFSPPFAGEYVETGDKLRCTHVQTTEIVWDVDMLADVVSAEALRDMVDTNISITNVRGFTDIMRKYGVPFSEFNKCAEITRVVNEKRLDQAEELGIVTKDMLRGCYTVKPKSDYLTITPVEQEKPKKGGDEDW